MCQWLCTDCAPLAPSNFYEEIKALSIDDKASGIVHVGDLGHNATMCPIIDKMKRAMEKQTLTLDFSFLDTPMLYKSKIARNEKPSQFATQSEPRCTPRTRCTTPIMKDWRGPACQSFFWYDDDKNLAVCFPAVPLKSELKNLKKHYSCITLTM